TLPPSLRIAILAPLALFYAPVQQLADALFRGRMTLPVEPAADSADRAAHEAVFADGTAIIPLEHISAGTIGLLVAAQIVLVVGVLIMIHRASRGVAHALDGDFSTRRGVADLSAAFWVTVIAFVLYAALMILGAHSAIDELNGGIWPSSATAVKADLLRPENFWIPVGALGLLWALRALVSWGLSAEKQSEGLI
ncbi:MAG: hypothetical protein L0I17_07085, partial [Actinomycetia bacterium]|nr:hypothetical protein [Actinomycetes bacterium]